MAELINLTAEPRVNVGFGVKALRRTGKVPAVVYGHRIAPTHIQLDDKEVSTALRKSGRNSLITLNVVGSGPKMVLAREIQRNAIKRTLIHIDFYEVSMNETIRTQIRVILEGVPAEVKGGTGVLLQELPLVDIECLPSQLFNSVTLDISGMKIDDVIRVKDLVVPEGVQVHHDPETEVVRIGRFVETKEEEVVAETSDVEVIEKGKKEDEAVEEKKK